jgi:hypothetical protein
MDGGAGAVEMMKNTSQKLVLIAQRWRIYTKHINLEPS